MKKHVIPFALSAVLAGSLVLPQIGLALSESDKIKQQLEQLKKQQATAQQKSNDAQSQMTKVQQEKQQTNKDIKLIMNQLDETNRKLGDLNDKVTDVTRDLNENAQELENAEGRVVSRDQMLRSRLRLMYMNGFVSYADVLLSSTSFSDFLDRLNALKSIVNQDKDILEANKRDRDLITEKQHEIENQLAEAKALYAEVEAVKADLTAQEKEKEVKVATLSKKEKELEELNEEQEKQLIAIAKEQSRLIAEQAKLNKKPITYTYSGGKFAYPLEKQAPMTSDFGTRADPFTGKKTTHNGIDLGAPQGTNILAAENGVVIVAGWVSGYGNTVIIEHKPGVWSLYGHIRNGGIKVEKGQSVKRGEKIAEVGSTGQSTGNHLHFEVRVNEQAVDPKPYLR